jgi:host factor-I protein
MDKNQNLQDVFLNTARRQHISVTLFLVNGVKLQGLITWFDNYSILLKRDGHIQLIYKHAVSTIMPAAAIDLQEQLPDDTEKT